MVDRAFGEVGLLGRRVEVGDRIGDGSTMGQPEEVEVGRRSSSLLFTSGI